MTKKIYKTILICILIVCASLSLVACKAPPSLPENGDYSAVFARAVPTLTTDSNGDFNILQLTDLHLLGNGNKYELKLLDKIKTEIASDKYDLVVITGDMLEGYNKKPSYNKRQAIAEIASVFENAEQYWCFITGNNDGEMCGSVRAINVLLAEYSYCIVSDTEGVGGTGNCVIPIYNNAVLAHNIVLMDSGSRNANGDIAPIYGTELEWFRAITARTKNENVRQSLFMHIPMDEYNNAYQYGEVVTSYNNYAGITDIYKSNADVNEIMVASQVNGLVATGHLHSNDYVRFYNGLYYLAVKAAGITVNLPKQLAAGGANITIHTSADSIKNMYTFNSVNFI